MVVSQAPALATSDDSPLLMANEISAGYGMGPAISSLSLHVRAGEVVVLLGPNGAGKTTTLLALGGELPLTAGDVFFRGKRTEEPLHRRAQNGLGFITEASSVISSFSVRENLRIGRCDVAEVLHLFPELDSLMGRRGGLLSGGEQRMLSVARALARRPVLVMADELSFGLAPLVVRRLLDTLRAAADRGMGVLIVEQHVRLALGIADRAYVLRRGRVVLEGTGLEMADRIHEIQDSYMSATTQTLED